MNRRIALVAGYTAGHINAAVAVAEGYRKFHPTYELVFIGERGGMEAQMIRRLGLPFHGIPASPVMGRGIARKIIGLLTLCQGFLASRRYFKQQRTDLAIGFGGYATVGALLAAWSLRIPTVIHEANVVAGRANRLLGKIANRILLTTGETRGAFPNRRVRVVGQPIRAEILALLSKAPVPADMYREPAHILVMGGSLGSDEINCQMPLLTGILKRAGMNFSVLHQAGTKDVERVRLAYEVQGVVAEVVSYIEHIDEAYAEAQFIATAAGANTLAELSLAGVPALLVPLRSAVDNHQIQNALSFVRKTSTMIATDANWDIEQLGGEICTLLTNADKWSAVSKRIRSCAKPDAVEAFLREIQDLWTITDDPIRP